MTGLHENSKRRCCEPVMGEEWDRSLHLQFASASDRIDIATSEWD